MEQSLLTIGDEDLVDVDEIQLAQFWNGFFEDHELPGVIFNRRIFIDSFKSQVVENPGAGGLFFTTKGFKISLTGNIVKSAVLSSYLVAALNYFGDANIPETTLLAVLFNLFQVDRIELKKSEEEILATIPLKPKKYRWPRKLYKELPEEIKADLTYLAFLDFLNLLKLGGIADTKAGKYRIFSKDKYRFKLSFV